MEQSKEVNSMINTWASGWYPTAEDMNWTRAVIDDLEDGVWITFWFSMKLNKEEKTCKVIGIEKDHTDNLHTLARTLKVLDYLDYTIYPPDPEEN